MAGSELQVLRVYASALLLFSPTPLGCAHAAEPDPAISTGLLSTRGDIKRGDGKIEIRIKRGEAWKRKRKIELQGDAQSNIPEPNQMGFTKCLLCGQ